MNIGLLPSPRREVVDEIPSASPDSEIVFITLHDQQVCGELTELMHATRFVAKQSLNCEIPRILEEAKRTKNRTIKDHAFDTPA